MAYADPQTITINAVATSLPRTASGVNTGGFTANDGSLQLDVAHAYGKRQRRTIRLTHKKIVTDPLLTNTSRPVDMSVYLVVNAPPMGYTVTEQKQIVDGFIANLTASSGAKITQLLGGEN